MFSTIAISSCPHVTLVYTVVLGDVGQRYLAYRFAVVGRISYELAVAAAAVGGEVDKHFRIAVGVKVAYLGIGDRVSRHVVLQRFVDCGKTRGMIVSLLPSTFTSNVMSVPG